MREGDQTAQAGQVLEGISVEPQVLVIGGGWVGLKAAYELSQYYKVILVESGSDLGGRMPVQVIVSGEKEELEHLLKKVMENGQIDILLETRLLDTSGMPGGFSIQLGKDGEIQERRIGAIVVAKEVLSTPLVEDYGIGPSAKNILTQSQIESVLACPEEKENLFGQEAKEVIFLVGLKQEGNPLMMERAMLCALEIQRMEGCNASVITGNVKLASNGLEGIYRHSRENGVLYFKLKEPPRIEQDGDRLNIIFTDPVMYEEIVLKPDILVLEEELRPREEDEEIARLLGIDVGPGGFLQEDNIHNLPVRSNRVGIYVVGSLRGPLGLRDGWTDVGNVVLEVRNLLGKGKRVLPKNKVKIHRGKCTTCLTCFRLCPHGAIYWDNRAVISPLACEGCGICASECPMDAIQILDYHDDQIKAEILNGKQRLQLDDATPWIVAFCCQNSAYEAGQTAISFNMPVPRGLQMVEVPCAGKIDIDYIMSSFEYGADGVLVLACHKDNCKSIKGNIYAELRVDNTRNMLDEIGLGRERVEFKTIASNMPVEFVQTVHRFETRIKDLGPTPRSFLF